MEGVRTAFRVGEDGEVGVRLTLGRCGVLGVTGDADPVRTAGIVSIADIRVNVEGTSRAELNCGCCAAYKEASRRRGVFDESYQTSHVMRCNPARIEKLRSLELAR